MGHPCLNAREKPPCPVHPSRTSAAHSASCTNPAASSSPIRGMSARRATCKASASRRWPRPRRAMPGRWRMPTMRSASTWCWRISKEICAAADVPVNADFEGGYADDPAGVARNVARCCETGVAGLSIEDSTGNKDKPLYDIPFAVERMKAARAAIDKAGARRAADRPRRGLHRGRARSRADDRAAQGLCGRRRRLPLCAGHPHARADRGGGARRWRRSR